VGVDATGWMLSGGVLKGVLVRDWDEAEARLPVEELLLTVRTGVIVSGPELTTFCFGHFPANGRVSSATRPSGGCSEDVSAASSPAVDMPGPEMNGTQRREPSDRSRGSAFWLNKPELAPQSHTKEQQLSKTGAELGLGPGGLGGGREQGWLRDAGRFVFTGKVKSRASGREAQQCAQRRLMACIRRVRSSDAGR
jgi:hypothetical protein